MADIVTKQLQIGDNTYKFKDEEARQQLATKQDAIEYVTASVDTYVGTPSVNPTWNNGTLDFAFHNVKGEQGIQGIQGPQGLSCLVGEGDLPLDHVLGQDGTKAMSQKGVTDAINEGKISNGITTSTATPELYHEDSTYTFAVSGETGQYVNAGAWRSVELELTSDMVSITYAADASSFDAGYAFVKDGGTYVSGSGVSTAGNVTIDTITPMMQGATKFRCCKNQLNNNAISLTVSKETFSWPQIYEGLGANVNGWMTQKAVTDALDMVGVTEKAVDLDEAYTLYFFILNNKWNSSQNITFGKHICTCPGTKYRITADANLPTVMWMLGTFTTPVNNASVTATRVNIDAGATEIITVPSGIYHLYFQDNSNIVTPAPNQKLPSEVIELKPEIVALNALAKSDFISEYGYDDCTNPYNMKIDGTLSGANVGFLTSDYISIPAGATHVAYKGLQSNYQDNQCGIVLCDNSKVVLWYDTRISGPVSGIVDLSGYPSAQYVRFMGALKQIDCSVEFLKQHTNDFSDVSAAIQGSDATRIYGCTEASTIANVSSGIRYFGSLTPCLDDGEVEQIYCKLQGTGTARFVIGNIDQNGYFIMRDSFTAPAVAGVQTINVSHLHKTIKANEHLLIDCTGSYVKPYFGNNEAVNPKAFCINQENKYTEFSGGPIYLSMAFVVNTHKPSITEMQDELDAVKNAVDINSAAISELQNSKKVFVSDSVTGTTYQIVVRNGVLGIVPMQFSKVCVLGNSITWHDIEPREGRMLWWGEWGMAATKAEYDMVHIIQEGLQVKDPEAEVLYAKMAPWERDFTLDLATIIGDSITSETDLVVIRLGENVPTANVPSFESALEDLIDYIYSVAPNAKVVITGVFWANSSKEAAITTAAAAKGIDYIKIDQYGVAGSVYEELQGHYVYGDDDEIHAIDNHGVEIHPSNNGMLAIANSILSAIGYETVNKSYSLQEVTVGGVTGMMYVEDEQ